MTEDTDDGLDFALESDAGTSEAGYGADAGYGVEAEWGVEDDGIGAEGPFEDATSPSSASAATLDERLRAVERAVAEESADVPSGPAPDEEFVSRLTALEERASDLEAELRAVRGQLDHVAAVDDAVERRADAALAAAESARDAASGRDDADPTDRSTPRAPATEAEGYTVPDPPAPPASSVSGAESGLLARLLARFP